MNHDPPTCSPRDIVRWLVETELRTVSLVEV
jgi:hypothetical protein